MPTFKRPVLFCGDNPRLGLFVANSDQLMAAASYWHATHSAVGPGQVLVIWVDPELSQLGNGAPIAVFGDNLPLAGMVTQNFTQYFAEFSDLGVGNLTPIRARLGHEWNGRDHYRVYCHTANHVIKLDWRNPVDHKQMSWEGFQADTEAFDLTAVICPCASATIVVNHRTVPGEVMTGTKDGRPTSSAFLAFAETWVARS